MATVSLADWPEVSAALTHGRFELVLKNVDSAKRKPSIDDEDLQKAMFPENSPLNLLYIGHAGLGRLSSAIAHAANLTNLVLKNNALKELPSEIGDLQFLKLIDVSANELTALPASMSKLLNLQSLDVAKNQLTTDGFPDFSGLAMLHILDASHNALTRFPMSLCSEELVKLHTVNLSANKIVDFPLEFSQSPAIKDFKMENNALTELPLALALHERLKFLDIRGNPFADRRFRKLANDARAKVSSIVDYLGKKYAEQEDAKEGENGVTKGDEEGDGQGLRIRTHVENMTVKVLESVAAIRPHLLTCVVRGLDLAGGNFRKFINLQTRLHQSECAHRTVAAMGTHDITALKMPLRYLALPHEELHITALHKKVPVSARDLLANLLLDSELARKREKRSTVSPVHRYLHLVKDLPLLACLIDAEGLVISLSPLTNSDLTKLTEATRDILVEVSSAESLEACYTVMDALIVETRSICPDITIDQIRVHNEKGDLTGEYPSRASLPDIEKQFVKEEPAAAAAP